MPFLIAVLSVFAVLACHWFGLLVIRAAFTAALARLGPRGGWGEDLAFAIGILLLIGWLFIDVAFCALLITVNWKGDLGFTQGFLFAIASFTTVGADPPSPSPFWSLAGPLTAMCGIFIFGWTTSFLVDCAHAVRDFRVSRNLPPSRITNW